MRKAYTTEYIRATVGATANQHGSYRLLTLSGPAVATRLALPADFSEGTTLLPGGGSVPIMLSPAARAQGFDTFYRAPARSYSDRPLYRWMRAALFGGDSLARAYAWPLAESFLVFVIALAFSTPRDIRRLKE